VLLALAYAGLIAVVLGGGVWIQGQLDDAHHERCDLADLQVGLARVEVQALAEGTPPVEISEGLQALIDKISNDCQ